MYEINGLHVLCDWCAFTIEKKSVYDFLDMFGFETTMFKLMPTGARGYKKFMRHKEYEITVFFDGNEDMGIHCEVKGSAMSYFLECFKDSFLVSTPWGTKAYEVVEFGDLEDMLPLLFKRIHENGWFTRLDVAIDDYGCNYFSCAEVEKLLKKRAYVAKFRNWESIISRDCQGIATGYTVYCGSRRSSDMFLRIYDKRLEQLQKDGGENNSDWVRWEFQLKDERADSFADYIVSGKGFAPSATALLNGYLRFIRHDDSNVTRCSTLPKWKKFVDTVERLRICAPKKPKSVLRSYSWFERQCAPTVAGLIVANGGSCDFIMDGIKKFYGRLKKSDREMYEKYCENIEKEIVKDGFTEIEKENS